jgi:hypothetical protein
MSKEIIDVKGCVDCLMFCANGDFPPENTEQEDQKLIGAFHHIYDQGFDVCAGSEDEGLFSWTPCDICNSSLGGDRFTMHLIRRQNENNYPR